MIEVFTPLEQQLLEDYGNINFSAPVSVVMICLYTGMRIGEALGLRWGDIDKHERTIRVQRERYYALGDDGKWQVFTDTPKTFASARTIPLCNKAWCVIQRMRHRSEYIFTDRDCLLTVRKCQYAFRRMQQMCGVRVRNFHTLRHTFATRLLENGVDFKTLSELLGHESVAITMRIYSHSLMRTKRLAVATLDKL